MKNNLPACSLAQKLGILLAGAALGVFCNLGLSRKEAEQEPFSDEI
ncbi:MAG: hypothetical protein PF795_08895 [Kiritimatiellae bacterium]|jgi:hypothetical protein|nr:hypothetical protein [Kiritimatiellia bacterium]